MTKKSIIWSSLLLITILISNSSFTQNKPGSDYNRSLNRLLTGEEGTRTSDTEQTTSSSNNEVTQESTPQNQQIIIKPGPRSIQVLNFARSFLSGRYNAFQSGGQYFRADCSGFITYIFAVYGINITSYYGAGGNLTANIFYGMQQQNAIHYNKSPNPGDIVFFHRTFDWNRDGKLNDPLTHIGIVESVNSEGTITYIHLLNPYMGVRRDYMNLHRPYDSSVNSPLGVDGSLSGALFAGFATVTR